MFLEISKKFAGKHLWQSLFFDKVVDFFKKETLAHVFSCEFWANSNNTFFAKYLRVTAPSKFNLNNSRSWNELLVILIIFHTSCTTLREKCPNPEFFLVRIFPHSDWIRRDTRSASYTKISKKGSITISTLRPRLGVNFSNFTKIKLCWKWSFKEKLKAYITGDSL